jgi:hypothetical protein
VIENDIHRIDAYNSEMQAAKIIRKFKKFTTIDISLSIHVASMDWYNRVL